MESFDAVYVINLESRTDRMEKVTDQLHFLQIPFERFNAVHMDTVEGLFKNLVHLNPLTSLSNSGYLACLLSHLSVYKTALDHGHKKILVLEDDLFIHKDVKEKVGKFMTLVPNDWDMIYFGYLPLTDDLQNWTHNHFEFIPNTSEMVFRGKGLWCTHAYAIREAFMKETIEHYNTTLIKDWLEIDRHFVLQQQKNFENINRKINFYGCSPSLFGQCASTSDLTNGFYTLPNEIKFINTYLTPRSEFL
jgi:GR25 family glycosyltransferase involved in LPS biosynthesis